MREFVIKREGTPCMFMAHFENPPFATVEETVKSTGLQLAVEFKAYNYEAKHFEVCKVE